MANTISSTDDIISVEDIIERIEELEAEIEAYAEKMDDWQGNADNEAELDTLKALMGELKGNGGDVQFDGDWYPQGLIRDSYFETAMDELIDDIGELPELPSYIIVSIDYKALQMDYSSVEFDGVTYWYR